MIAYNRALIKGHFKESKNALNQIEEEIKLLQENQDKIVKIRDKYLQKCQDNLTLLLAD